MELGRNVLKANNHNIEFNIECFFLNTCFLSYKIYAYKQLWNTCHAAKDVLPACQGSLKDLGLDYLDLYLIHWPTAWKVNRVDARFLVAYQ